MQRSIAEGVVAAWIAIAAGAVAGEKPKSAVAAEPIARVAAATLVERIRLDLGDVAGISGLTSAGDQTLWAVPERGRFLVPLRLFGSKLGLLRAPVPLEGVPAGLDTESIGWVEGDVFALGTESQVDRRQEDRVLLVRLEAGVARVFDAIPLPYEAFGVRPRANQGLEAICVVGNRVVVGLESVGDARGLRVARLFIADLRQRRWSPALLKLSTATGKLAALECRAEQDGILAIAIERHYGVAHLLRFHLQTAPAAEPIVPEVVANLAAIVPGVPNMEGLAFGGPGEILIAIDNDTSGTSGPNEVLVIRVPGL
ncbi:MAG: esterase-like activity of phytase family protein [Deltaproteobacteria bacterium]|nr:esterase-like activity of phytase family protein [Deltaproteobacteria bacterium]